MPTKGMATSRSPGKAPPLSSLPVSLPVPAELPSSSVQAVRANHARHEKAAVAARSPAVKRRCGWFKAEAEGRALKAMVDSKSPLERHLINSP